jgi:choline kinase
MAVLSANDVQVHLHMRKGSLIAEQRQQLAEESKTVGSQEILWLDSDMQFPFDLYKRLHTHNKTIVGTAYSTKTERSRSTAVIETSGMIEYLSSGTGLQRVDAFGFGAVLMQASVFDGLPRPWFNTSYNYEYDYHNGEDVFFCELATEHGYKLWVDMDLSRELGHIGSKDYRL